MQLTCTYVIKEVDDANNTMIVTYSLAGYQDISLNLSIPSISYAIDKYITDRIPYASWILNKETRHLSQDLQDKAGELTFDDSRFIKLTDEEVKAKAIAYEAKRLIELEYNINRVLQQQEEITL